MILKKYKNELFNVLIESTIGVDHFDTVDEITENILSQKFSYLKILLRNSRLVFKVIPSSVSFDKFGVNYTRFAPNFPESNVSALIVQIDNFGDVKSKFIEWLNNDVSRYLSDKNELDLWSNYLAIQANFTEIDYREEVTFTLVERQQIKNTLNQFQLSLVQKIKFDSGQLDVINERTAYLIEAVDRLNKTDWKGVAISTMIGLVTALSVDVNTGRLIIDIFKKSFQILPRLPF